ncbi:putative transcription factor C3H family [Helianthus annuus]|nr:putative transcription factor C3H family [Helianthus annuus]KAJ0939599.1 putative transcription factor C3H family [Helianthus annuus]
MVPMSFGCICSDINEGVYGTDEFRMHMFKVKPCSRAYSHDWTKCPFVHPGENARRHDPRKHQYTCVLCPAFRKGSCVKGDLCEFAYGAFRKGSCVKGDLCEFEDVFKL